MADPTNATTIPYLMGLELSSSTAGVAYSNMIAYNRTTGDRMIKSTDSGKRVIFDAAHFISGYNNGDVIEFENVGGSYGGTTHTITDVTGGLNIVSITTVATPAFTRSL